jgi:hypothetical protein
MEWHQQNLAELESLPAIYDWFVDWVTPVHGGRQDPDSRHAAGLDQMRTASRDSSTDRNAVGTTPAVAPIPIRRSTPWVPTPFQHRILNALKGMALTADGLQTRLGADRKDLYERGINPLKEADKILNSRRVGGYYRPDFPPAKFAEFLGKKCDPETEPPTKETEPPTDE